MAKKRKPRKKASKHGMGDQLGGGNKEQAALQSDDWTGSEQAGLLAKVLELRRLQAQVAAKLRQAEARMQVANAKTALQSALSELACADAYFVEQGITNGLGAGFSSDGNSNRACDLCKTHFDTQKLTSDGVSVSSISVGLSNDDLRSKSLSAKGLGMVDHPSGDSSDEGHGSRSTHDLSTVEGSVCSVHTSVCGVGDCCESSDNCDASDKFNAQKLTNGDLSVSGDMRTCKSLGADETSTRKGSFDTQNMDDGGLSVSSGMSASQGLGGCGTGDLSVSGDVNVRGDIGTSKSVSKYWRSNGDDGHSVIGTSDLSVCDMNSGNESGCGCTSVCGDGDGSPCSSLDNGDSIVCKEQFNTQNLTSAGLSVSGDMGASNGLGANGMSTSTCGAGSCCESDNSDAAVCGVGSRNTSTINRFTKRRPRGGLCKGKAPERGATVYLEPTQAPGQLGMEARAWEPMQVTHCCEAAECHGMVDFNAQNIGISNTTVGTAPPLDQRLPSTSGSPDNGEASVDGDLSTVDNFDTQQMTNNGWRERENFKKECQKWLTEMFGQGGPSGRGGLTARHDLGGGVNMFNTQELANVGVSVRDGIKDDDLGSVIATVKMLGYQYGRSLRLQESFDTQSLNKDGLSSGVGTETEKSKPPTSVGGGSCAGVSDVIARARLIAAGALRNDALSNIARPATHHDQLE